MPYGNAPDSDVPPSDVAMDMAPALTVVANIAPNEINAPPRTLSTKQVQLIGGSLVDAAFFGARSHRCGQQSLKGNDLRLTRILTNRFVLHDALIPNQPRLAPAIKPTTCTAMTLMMVMDGKIIAYPMSGFSVGAIRVE